MTDEDPDAPVEPEPEPLVESEPEPLAESEPEPPGEPQVQEQEMSEEGVESQTVEEEPQLPPTLAAAGLVAVRGQVSGNYTVPSGASFWVSPGQAYAVSPEDAAALTEMGVVVDETVEA